MEFVNQQFLSDVPGFEILKTAFLNPLVTDVTRIKISQSLGPWTICAEQKEAVLKSALLKLVARTSSRVFLGDVGCRNPAWLKITKEFTVNSFMACVELRKYPPGFRHIVHWFLPECKTVRARGQTTRNIKGVPTGRSTTTC
ncbi:cytochrome P450 [Colletotrichum filicis]|nr:cytochrome P450 [Colletotrichum filicis]